MKNIINYFILLVSFMPASLQACDICGCSAGGISGGLFPQIQNNMGGVRYSGLMYLHPTKNPNFNGNSQLVKDAYHDAEAFIRWFPAPRWQFWVNVPYSFRIREESLRSTLIKGIGDLRFNAFYSLLKRDSTSYRFRHLLLAGAGISLPTGKYQQRDETLVMLPIGFQIGTGSWSGSLRLIYMLQFRNAGLIAQGAYRSYSVNERLFKKGDIADAGLSLFRTFNLNSNTRLFLHAGYKSELLSEDIEYSIRKPDSGSLSGWMNFSADLIRSPFLLSLSSDIPTFMQYNGNQPLPGLRTAISLALIW